MKLFQRTARLFLLIATVTSPALLFAHDSSSIGPSEGMIVTRHFTGIWDQVDQEAQGIALQVVEQLDDSRRAVAYWYTYGNDRKTAWYIGIGDLVENRIEMELFESTDVGFLQDAVPGNDTVSSIGTMVISFDSCAGGEVTFDTSHPEVGSGSFRIERLLEVMNTHCTGGISDDAYADAMFGEQRIDLAPAREGISGSGHARYEDVPGHMEFDVEVAGLPDGNYHLYVGMQERGDFTVQEGRGEIRFTSPAEDGRRLMNFDPRGMQIEVRDGQGTVLSSFDETFEEHGPGHQGGGYAGGNDHDYDCASGTGHGMGGGGMGGGMRDCVDDGEFLEIEAELQNSGVLPEAGGEAEWEMNSHRVMFSVAIEDVPVGTYPLRVGGVEVGTIETFEMHGGNVYGRLSFRDPEAYGRELLDFEPRGQKIEVLKGTGVILEVDFPAE
ncbi:MAG: hypothetical protein OQK01_05300 [Xanthomonadales bacterium]|jgi:hypothetical protein|nr:hypothetical protein [Xanthomonadales bacterium]